MTILSEIQTVMTPLNIPVETGVFTTKAPDQYIGYEAESGYHHYNVDVAKYYEMEE